MGTPDCRPVNKIFHTKSSKKIKIIHALTRLFNSLRPASNKKKQNWHKKYLNIVNTVFRKNKLYEDWFDVNMIGPKTTQTIDKNIVWLKKNQDDILL
jgi:hypothetical protein